MPGFCHCAFWNAAVCLGTPKIQSQLRSCLPDNLQMSKNQERCRQCIGITYPSLLYYKQVCLTRAHLPCLLTSYGKQKIRLGVELPPLFIMKRKKKKAQLWFFFDSSHFPPFADKGCAIQQGFFFASPAPAFKRTDWCSFSHPSSGVWWDCM